MTLFSAPFGAVEPTRTRITVNTVVTVLAADALNAQPISQVHICNKHTSDVKFRLEVYDGTNSTFLEYDRTITTGSSFEIYDQLLAPTESLRVTSNNASGLLDITVYSALPRRTGG